jgi:hypothetical protein
MTIKQELKMNWKLRVKAKWGSFTTYGEKKQLVREMIELEHTEYQEYLKSEEYEQYQEYLKSEL